MDGLFPLIVAILVAVFAASAKKKNKNTPDQTTQGSPWDDLLRELNGQFDIEKSKPAESNESPQTDENYSYESVTEPEYVPEQTVFSYDDEVIAEQEAAVYQMSTPVEQVTPVTSVSPVMPVISLQSLRVPPVIFEEPAAAVTGSTTIKETAISNQSNRGFFSNGFDPKMAVVYAEIMKPKFQEY